MVVGQNLLPEEVMGLQQLFKSMDVDDDGRITVDELRAALQQWEHKFNTQVTIQFNWKKARI